MITNLIIELTLPASVALIICALILYYIKQIRSQLVEITKGIDYLESRINSLETENKYLKGTIDLITNHKEEKIIVPLIDPNAPTARFNSEGCIIEGSRENLEDISNVENLED